MPPKRNRNKRLTAKSEEKPVVEEKAPEPETSSARPKRTQRRNHLYTDEHYELPSRTSYKRKRTVTVEAAEPEMELEEPVEAAEAEMELEEPVEAAEPVMELEQPLEEKPVTNGSTHDEVEEQEDELQAEPSSLGLSQEDVMETRPTASSSQSGLQRDYLSLRESPPLLPSNRSFGRARKGTSKRSKVGSKPKGNGRPFVEPAPILEAQVAPPMDCAFNMAEQQQQELLYGNDFFLDGSDLVVAEEYEVPHDDRGTPPLGHSVPFFDNETDLYPASDESTNSEGDEEPPNLEMVEPKKKRGRPKFSKTKKPPVPKIKDPDESPYSKLKPHQKASARLMIGQSGQPSSCSNQRAMRLFEDEIGTTPEGDAYATVIQGCLSELLRKDRIVELLTSSEEMEYIRQGGWFLEKIPRLPPLTEERGCYAFYVNGTNVPVSKDLTDDDLRPWTVSDLNPKDRSHAVKPGVRRHPVVRRAEKLTVSKIDPRLAEYYLTEYTARLPRDQRLRKKVFYLSRDGQVHGNILILYDYTAPGLIPTVEPTFQSNTMLQSNYEIVDIEETDENYAPFEPEIIQGPRGGDYLKLKPHLSAWSNNKKTILDWIFNSANLIESTGVVNTALPDLPPLSEAAGQYVYFVLAQTISNVIHHASDGLSPWTSLPSGITNAPTARVRSTRRPLHQEADGYIYLAPKQRSVTDLTLVETVVVLARCRRVRRKLYYIQTAPGGLIGYACYLYEFTEPGPIPELFPPKIPGRFPVFPEEKWKPMASKHAVEQRETMFGEDDGDMQMQMMDVMDADQAMIVDMTQQEDVLNGGFDDAFMDEDFNKADTSEPFYYHFRELEAGYVYLTVRHKKIAATFETVLDWISNSNTVTERGLLNNLKPGHPPLVTNARAYVFFVAGTAIFPHDINRDDFSPWSGNGTPENPTCYRTKVRKLGVVCDIETSRFQVMERIDYKDCPYHLVYLYSIHPKSPRLRKKIYYVMETESKLIVSHVMILYEYNTEGPLPQLHAGTRARPKKGPRQTVPVHDVFNDVSDIDESDKECPFVLPFLHANDNTIYMVVKDLEIWNDRNRQLHYLINHPSLLQEMECLNMKVPDLPPLIDKKGMFIFFVDGEEVTFRNLTSDCLAPWSDSTPNNKIQIVAGVTRRPKSAKTPLALNRDNQLRVWRNGALQTEDGGAAFQLHTYTATLPRCPRLRKKIAYVMKGDRQVGHAMILYHYMEPGPIPRPIQRATPKLNTAYIDRLDPEIRAAVVDLLKQMTPVEVAKTIENDYSVRLNPMTLHNLVQGQQAAKLRYMNSYGTLPPSSSYPDLGPIDPKHVLAVEAKPGVEYTNSDGSAPSSSQPTDHILIADHEILTEHHEVIETVQYVEEVIPSHPILTKTQGAVGSVRGSKRENAFWRIAQNHLGASSMEETFDGIFRVLHERNEPRLLHAINRAYGVEIFPSAQFAIQEGEEVIETEHTL